MTVSDVMKLPSMVGAEVVAGHRGLSNPVESITVMEYGRATETLDHLFQGNQFSGNELIISAFASIWDDVDAQCLNVRKYHAVGHVGIALYYVGIILPEIDQRLIDVCNELDFVLICLPPKNFAHRYSELISEVLFEVFREQERNRFFVSALLDRLSNLPTHQRTMTTLLRMLSEHLRVSVILTNQKSEVDSIIAWPWALQSILKAKVPGWVKKIGNSDNIRVTLGDGDAYLQLCPKLLDDTNNLRLYLLKYGEALPDDTLWQAGEAVRLFIHIWDRSHGRFVVEELVRAIINDEPIQKIRLASLFHINVEAMNQMWVFIPKEKKQPHNSELLTLCTEQLSGISSSLLIGYYDENLVAFTQAPKTAVQRESLADAVTAQFCDIENEFEILCCDCLSNTTDARKAYLEGVKFAETARKLYPLKKVLRTADITFAKVCLQMIDDKESFSQYLSILKLLDENSSDLVPTLTAYLLDTPSNMGQTANLLFIHLNTVKYRLHQIHNLTGYDPLKLPDAYPLYMVASLKRLISGK